MTTVLEAQSVSKAFGGVRALKGVSLALRAGEVHGLVGENGAGKSTLIKVFSGVVHPDSGRVLCFERPVEISSPRVAQELGISTVFQEPSFYPDLSVVENMFMGREMLTRTGGIDRAGQRRRAAEQFRTVGVDASFIDAPARALTLGQLQLMLIAKALLHEARIIILDEPTAILTAKETEDLFRVIRTLRSRGIGTIYISHRLEEVFTLTDRVTVMRDGERVATSDTSVLDRDAVVELMLGRSLDSVSRSESTAAADRLLEAEKLSRSPAYRDISFHLMRGEILGFFGLVGSGRSDVAQAIAGLRPAHDGTLRVRGKPVVMNSPQCAARAGIAYVPEDRKTQGLFPTMPVKYNISIGFLRSLARLGFFVDEGRERDECTRLVGALSIRTQGLNVPIESLSGGNQQKVVLARWLARMPAVLILDEPTRGVDVAAKEEIHRRVFELADAGVGLIVISSELPEVMKLTDRIVVMHEGTIRGVYSSREVSAELVLRTAIGE